MFLAIGCLAVATGGGRGGRDGGGGERVELGTNRERVATLGCGQQRSGGGVGAIAEGVNIDGVSTSKNRPSHHK